MDSVRTRVALAAAIGAVLAVVPLLLLSLRESDQASWIAWTAAFGGIALALVVGWVLSAAIAHDIDNVHSTVRRAVQGDLDVSTPDASIHEVSQLGKDVGRLINQFQVSEQRNAQEQRWVEAIFDGLQDGIMLVDSDEQVIAANGQVATLLGVSGEIQVGQRLMMITRDYELVEQFRAMMRSGERQLHTVYHSLSERFIDIAVLPVENEGQLLGLVVLRDVTDLRRLELVRREFVANVSHELKTPLASIRALADTLEAGAIDDPAVSSDFLKRIAYEVDRLNGLVEELLDLGRLESGRLSLEYRAIAPEVLIERSAERLRHQIEGAGLTLQIDVAPTLSPATVDGARVEQVLINLVQNAIKFTPSGGSISISATENEGWLRIQVADTGVGIHEDELPRLFERFYKSDRARRSSGTGLGLAIAKHIVLTHGGKISVESTLGRGSTFIVELPMEPRQRSSASAHASSAS